MSFAKNRAVAMEGFDCAVTVVVVGESGHVNQNSGVWVVTKCLLFALTLANKHKPRATGRSLSRRHAHHVPDYYSHSCKRGARHNVVIWPACYSHVNLSCHISDATKCYPQTRFATRMLYRIHEKKLSDTPRSAQGLQLPSTK